MIHHHLDVAVRAFLDQINLSNSLGVWQLALLGVVGHIPAAEGAKTNPRFQEEEEGLAWSGPQDSSAAATPPGPPPAGLPRGFRRVADNREAMPENDLSVSINIDMEIYSPRWLCVSGEP